MMLDSGRIRLPDWVSQSTVFLVAHVKGHFWVTFFLCFKASSGAEPLVWKWVLLARTLYYIVLHSVVLAACTDLNTLLQNINFCSYSREVLPWKWHKLTQILFLALNWLLSCQTCWGTWGILYCTCADVQNSLGIINVAYPGGTQVW